MSDARADFIGYYAPENFTLTNEGGGIGHVEGSSIPSANGSAVFPDLLTLILTGTHDGSGSDGYTDLTITTPIAGIFRFDYTFSTDDAPHYQYAGYLVGSKFQLLADENGAPNATGTVSVDVAAGELIGFRAGGDNQSGLPGVLTVTNFSAPVPEPGSLQLLLLAGAAFGARMIHRHRRGKAGRR